MNQDEFKTKSASFSTMMYHLWMAGTPTTEVAEIIEGLGLDPEWMDEDYIAGPANEFEDWFARVEERLK